MMTCTAALDYPGRHSYPNEIPRDIGADEWGAWFHGVRLGVLAGSTPGAPAYAVESAQPQSVFSGVTYDPLTPDDPGTTADDPTPNPTITLEIGQRYEFQVTDATNHPIELVAFAPNDPDDPNDDIVLYSMDTYEVVQVQVQEDPPIFENVVEVTPYGEQSGQTLIESDSQHPAYESTDWSEDGHDQNENDLPDPPTVIGGRVSFVMTPELESAFGSKPGYRSRGNPTALRGAIEIVPSTSSSSDQDDGFHFW